MLRRWGSDTRNLVYPIRSDEGLTLERQLFNFCTVVNLHYQIFVYQCYVRGGGARDGVGTLNVRAHPTWGILANFEHKCWPRGREV